MEGDTILLNDVFEFERRGMDRERVLGSFQPTGVVPRFVEALRARDIEFPIHVFRRPGDEP